MKTDPLFQGVLLTRHDPAIQFHARKFLELDASRIGLITAEDPLHLFFHCVDDEAIEQLCGHVAVFLDGAAAQRIVLAAGLRPDALTPGEVHFKLETAAFHLHQRFPGVQVEALFVNQSTGEVELVVPSST